MEIPKLFWIFVLVAGLALAAGLIAHNYGMLSASQAFPLMAALLVWMCYELWRSTRKKK
jgi:fucose permease